MLKSRRLYSSALYTYKSYQELDRFYLLLTWRHFSIAFISSHLDCNSLYSCLSQRSISQLKSVQSAAERISIHSRKCDHITPILASFHQLIFRIDLKSLPITFTAKLGLAQKYICQLLTPCEPDRSLRSSGKGLFGCP